MVSDRTIECIFCHSASSVSRPGVNFHIFHLSSETAKQNSTKLDRKQDLNILYQVCVLQADQKTRWPHWPLNDWDVFYFFSETTE